MNQKIEYLKKEGQMRLDYRYFRYGGSANTMIILVSSILDQLLIGLVIVALLSLSYTFIKFLKNYLEMEKTRL